MGSRQGALLLHSECVLGCHRKSRTAPQCLPAATRVQYHTGHLSAVALLGLSKLFILVGKGLGTRR